MEVLETTEVIQSEYNEILTLIYNMLLEMNTDLNLLIDTTFLIAGILLGAISGVIACYFIGKFMRR